MVIENFSIIDYSSENFGGGKFLHLRSGGNVPYRLYRDQRSSRFGSARLSSQQSDFHGNRRRYRFFSGCPSRCMVGEKAFLSADQREVAERTRGKHMCVLKQDSHSRELIIDYNYS